jgi:hypothetical protein
MDRVIHSRLGGHERAIDRDDVSARLLPPDHRHDRRGHDHEERQQDQRDGDQDEPG